MNLVHISSTRYGPSHTGEGASGGPRSHSWGSVTAWEIVVCRNNQSPNKGAMETLTV